MAFDQPLEADKVGDGLLVSFVRGPVLGALMWILGEQQDEKKREHELQQKLQNMMLDDDDENWMGAESRVDDGDCSTAPNNSTLPRLVRSDISVAIDGGGEQSLLPRNLAAGSLGHCKNPRGEKKKMSWSENLVEYMDDESVRHEPPTGTGGSPAMAKPIKSAITRSASIRSYPMAVGAPGSEEKERTIRYLPNGLDRAHNGLIMPTRPVGNDLHHGNGIESPQWGWYINTTPPTPEMYHSRSSLKNHHHDKSDQSTASATSVSSSSDAMMEGNPATRGPNRVFQGLKAGSNRPTVGWPSVPL